VLASVPYYDIIKTVASNRMGEIMRIVLLLASIVAAVSISPLTAADTRVALQSPSSAAVSAPATRNDRRGLDNLLKQEETTLDCFSRTSGVWYSCFSVLTPERRVYLERLIGIVSAAPIPGQPEALKTPARDYPGTCLGDEQIVVCPKGATSRDREQERASQKPRSHMLRGRLF